MKQGWHSESIEDLCEVEYGTRVVRKRDAGTIYPVYGGGGATFSMDIYNREDRIVIARFAMSKRCTRFVDDRFFLNDSGLTISPLDGNTFDQDFLNYHILSLNDEIYSLARGTAQKNLNVDAFKKVKLSYPTSLEEQKQIVAKLDQCFEAIDKAKANAAKNLENAKELFQSKLNDIFSQKGEGWKSKDFEDCIDRVLGTTKIPKKQFLAEGNYPIISQEKSYINGYWNKSEDLLKVDRPLVVFGDHTKKLKYIDFDFVLGADGVKVLLPIKPIDARFFYYQLQSITLDDLGYARHYRLLKQEIIVYPPLEEQKKIVELIDKILEPIQSLESKYQQELNSLEELKKSILQKAFEGEL